MSNMVKTELIDLDKLNDLIETTSELEPKLKDVTQRLKRLKIAKVSSTPEMRSQFQKDENENKTRNISHLLPKTYVEEIITQLLNVEVLANQLCGFSGNKLKKVVKNLKEL